MGKPNGIAKAGGIIVMISAVLNIIMSILLMVGGGAASGIGASGAGTFLIIAGLVSLALSCGLFYMASKYLKDLSFKIALGVLSIIAAIFSASIIGLVLAILAAIFVFIGKIEEGGSEETTDSEE